MLFVTPYCRSTLWGGSRLFTYFPKVDLPNLAEAWIFSLSSAGEGTVMGESLTKVLTNKGVDKDTLSALPLVKLIDTADLLSVQVHPNDSEALALDGEPRGKNEMWYILDAEKDAFIYLNLKHDKAAFLSALDKLTPTDEMQKVYVKKGDAFLLPAGMVHALGKGITLLEVQQQSDLTYRLWDFMRPDANGELRPLHTEKAKAVLKALPKQDVEAFRYAMGNQKSYTVSGDAKPKVDCLANTPYFSLEIAEVDPNSPLMLSALQNPVILVCTEGEGQLSTAHETSSFGIGKTVCLLPSDGDVTLSGALSCAIISISPL